MDRPRLPSAPRVLFIRPDHLGDVLLTLPVVPVVKAALPGSRVCYGVPAGVTAGPEHCPFVDDVHAVPFPPLQAPWPPDSPALCAAAGRLRGRFDVALLTRPDDPWSGPLVAEAGIPVRIGFDMPRTAPFLTHAVPVRERRHATMLAADVVSVLCDDPSLSPEAITALDASTTTTLFMPSAAEDAEADAILAALGEDAPLLLHPGSGWRLKNWPPGRFGELATRLHRTHGLRSLVLGTPPERDLVAAVVASSGGSAVDLAGRLSLGGVAALQTRASAVVGTDSGPIQLAALIGAPTVALYGPADPDVFASADRARHVVVRIELTCSPCGTLEHPPCGARWNPSCLLGITVDAVSAAVDALLARPARPRRARIRD